MRMKNPPHPGQIVRQECIEPLGLTVTRAARALHVTRQTLNNLVNGRSGVWKSGELLAHYSDWKIEWCTEEIFDCISSGVPHQHAVNRIIARKP